MSNVNSPAHYGGVDNPHEHWKCMVGSGLVNNGFLYNATKYLWRAGKKANAPAVEDLEKARWYLNKAIELARQQPFTVVAGQNDRIIFGDKDVVVPAGKYSCAHELAEAIGRAFKNMGFPVEGVWYDDKKKIFVTDLDEKRIRTRFVRRKKR